MAKAITFSRGADEDLDGAIEFLGARSSSAKRLAESIDRAIATLLQFPEAGIALDFPRRSLFIAGTNYTIIYELHPDKIHVLAFAHSARQPGYWLERR